MKQNPEVSDVVRNWLLGAVAKVGTQKDFCALTGISARTLQNWLSVGKEPGSFTLVDISLKTGHPLGVMFGEQPDMGTVLDAMQGLEEWLHEQNKEINDPVAKRRLVEALAEMAWKDRNAKDSGKVVKFSDYAPFMRAIAGQ